MSRDPPDPSPDNDLRKISAAADRAREQVREEFQQLRAEIEELRVEEGGNDDRVAGDGFWNRALAPVAVLALSAALAAAAVNFGLNGGRSPKDGEVNVPPGLGESEPRVIAAGGKSAETPGSLLSLIAPGLEIGVFGSSAGIPGTGLPSTGSSPKFAVGELAPAGGHGSPGQDVARAEPVVQAPTPTPPTPVFEAPRALAYSPPPPPVDGLGGGSPDDGAGGGGKDPAESGKPGKGGGPARNPGGGRADRGKGLGKGHIKARGKGHGGSRGRGHEKDLEGGEVRDSGSGYGGSAGDGQRGHGHGESRGKGHETGQSNGESRGRGHEKDWEGGEVGDSGSGYGGSAGDDRGDPGHGGSWGDPPESGPGSGSNGKGGDKGKGHDRGNGRSTAPGQAGK